MMRVGLITAVSALGSVLPSTAHAEEVTDQDLAELSIEQLAQIPVTSASKTEEPLSSAPASIYVLTRDQIINSGVNSLPEALRLAPNLQVQQVDASQYAISARGFNGLEATNKLLVLIDGRSIYTPLASTVFWNLHWPMLEDVQQIEVISGPGGTLYGPNAVNGVINITSADAQQTLGTLARVSGGSSERNAALRHGFALGSTGAVRVYANYHDNDGLPHSPTQADLEDDWKGWQTGFRADFEGEADHVTVQGDLFRDYADTLDGDGAHGHNLLTRWSRALSPSSAFQVQAYYDYFKREFTLVEDSVSTLDGQAQLNLTSGRHAIVAGAGVRTTRDRFINDLNAFQLNPVSRRLWTYNLFAQDRFSLAPTLDVVAGLKVERSTFSGWELLPNLRLAWQPDPQTLIWAAVSRAVRTPSRIDRELEATGILAQSLDFQSEKLVAVEAGYRGQPTPSTSVSVNTFVNFYDDLRTTELTDGGLPFKLLNSREGRTYGIEAWGSIQLLPIWRVWLGASRLWKDLHLKDGHTDLIPVNSLGTDPKWQFGARTQVDLTPRLRLNLQGRAVGKLDLGPEVGSYVELGGRLAYRLTDNLELYLAGTNLLHKTHLESNNGAAQLPRRSVQLGTRVTF